MTTSYQVCDKYLSECDKYLSECNKFLLHINELFYHAISLSSKPCTLDGFLYG